MSFTLHGLPVSGGIAIGQAHLISQATLEVSHLQISPRLVEKEVARFEAALHSVREEFTAMKTNLDNAPAQGTHPRTALQCRVGHRAADGTAGRTVRKNR